MLRRCALILAIASLAGMGASVVPEEAQALDTLTSTYLRSLSQSELAALLADIDAQGLQTTGSPNVKTGVTRMQIASGRLATMRAVGTLPIIGTGAVVVWQIADALGLGGYIYKKITGETHGAAAGAATNPRWNCIGAAPCPTSSFNGHTTGWYFRTDQQDTPFATSTNYPTSGSCAGSGATLHTCQIATALTNVTWTHIGGNAYTVTRTDAQMEASVQLEPSTAAEYSSPPVGAVTRSGGTNDTTTPTSGEVSAALDAIDPVPGVTGTAVEQETAEAILDELDPGWNHTFITLLQPQPNETYGDYIARLQAEGWLGDAVSTELATVNDSYGPEAVVRVTYTQAGTTTTRTLAPLSWPASAPQIELNDDIAIRYNPDTAAPAPTEGTGAETTVTLPPTTVPPIDGIDFSPITDLDGACSFPFGFLCYAQDVTDWFDVSADAPVFDFDVTIPSLAGGGTIAYTVDLNVMDDYLALLRELISVVLWIGGVYFLAVNLLGFRMGGDPGEAADEGLNV